MGGGRGDRAVFSSCILVGFADMFNDGLTVDKRERGRERGSEGGGREGI